MEVELATLGSKGGEALCVSDKINLRINFAPSGILRPPLHVSNNLAPPQICLARGPEIRQEKLI